MKLNRIFAIMLAAMTMTACSDDDDTDYNTVADVTVNMEESTMTIPEDNDGMYNVPITVTGKANGMIKVTVEMEGVGSNAAKADEHYIVTTNYVYIPEGEQIGNIEFHATGDDVINEDRIFSIKIVKVEGAKIGTETTTTITLVDDDHLIPDALAKLEGQWLSKTSQDQYICKIEAYPENDPKHGKQVKLIGIAGSSAYAPVVCDFKVDGITEKIALKITCPQVLATNIPDEELGNFDVVALPYIGGLYLSGEISANSNADVTYFGFDGGIFGGMFVAGDHSVNGFLGYVTFQIPQLTLQKVQ